MKRLVISTREMSRGFTKFLRAVAQQKAEITVTSKGKPVAVLCPYEQYKRAQRRRALARLMELADQHLRGLTLAETYLSSRSDLEARGGQESNC